MSNLNRRLAHIAREIDTIPDPNVYLVANLADIARLVLAISKNETLF
jgi:hypothetical protein